MEFKSGDIVRWDWRRDETGKKLPPFTAGQKIELQLLFLKNTFTREWVCRVMDPQKAELCRSRRIRVRESMMEKT